MCVCGGGLGGDGVAVRTPTCLVVGCELLRRSPNEMHWCILPSASSPAGERQ